MDWLGGLEQHQRRAALLCFEQRPALSPSCNTPPTPPPRTATTPCPPGHTPRFFNLEQRKVVFAAMLRRLVQSKREGRSMVAALFWNAARPGGWPLAGPWGTMLAACSFCNDCVRMDGPALCDVSLVAAVRFCVHLCVSWQGWVERGIVATAVRAPGGAGGTSVSFGGTLVVAATLGLFRYGMGSCRNLPQQSGEPTVRTLALRWQASSTTAPGDGGPRHRQPLRPKGRQQPRAPATGRGAGGGWAKRGTSVVTHARPAVSQGPWRLWRGSAPPRKHAQRGQPSPSQGVPPFPWPFASLFWHFPTCPIPITPPSLSPTPTPVG